MLSLLLTSCMTSAKLERMEDAHICAESHFQERGIPKYASTLPEMYNTGTEWNERSMELISQAEDHILITIFLGNYHETTHEVWELLQKRMDDGVQVYLMIDSASYFQFDPESPETVVPAVFLHLEELGIPYVEYNPLTLSNLFLPLNLLDRDHRKFWVIDGEYAAVGGININYTSLGLPPETGNIDTMAEARSPETARALTETFVESWNAYAPEKISTELFKRADALDEADRETDLWLIDHYWKSPQVTDMFDLFFLEAQEELWLIQGYAFLTPALKRRIAHAADRGVEVHVMLSDYARKENYELAAFYGMLDLIDAGAKVWRYTSPIGAFLHYKLMMADEQLVALGSVNYNLRSQTTSREVSYVFDDPRVGEAVTEHLDELLAYARPVSREEALQYRTVKGFFYHLLMQFWG